MKKFLLVSCIVIGAATMFSCTPCVKCTHSFLPDSELCREDFDSDSDYQNAVDAAESVGYDCVP